MLPFAELITSQAIFKLRDVTKFVILEEPCFVELIRLCPQGINPKFLANATKVFGEALIVFLVIISYKNNLGPQEYQRVYNCSRTCRQVVNGEDVLLSFLKNQYSGFL